MSFDKSQLKTLCRGNRTDRGWTQDEAGNWTPSVHDRRRVATAHMGLVAEANGLPGLPAPAVMSILSFHAKEDEADIQALLENFGQWMKG